MKRKGHYRRGYPVAVLIGFEEGYAVLWQVFSEVVKLHSTVKLNGSSDDEKALYNFHESIVDALRPTFDEGVRSIVVAAPPRTDYSREFLDHLRKHHAWLIQGKGAGSVVFGELVGSASKLGQVAELVKTKEFHKLISETTSGEADQIIGVLEKRFNEIDSGRAVVLYSLKEIEDLIYSQWKRESFKPEYLLLTDKYLADNREKSRIHRLLQIAKNKNVKTRIISAETTAGKRLSQFGGLVCLTENK